MKIKTLFLIATVLVVSSTIACGQKISDLKFADAKDFALLLNQAYDNTEMLYSRLPEDMKGVTRKAVWDLGLNSAGLAIRFSTNSRCIGAKWRLLNNFSMSHMPGTGIRGIDFYALLNGKWTFVGTAKPNGKESESVVVRNMDGSEHEFMAYLPLYDGVEKIEIGVDSTALIGGPRKDIMARGKGFSRKPIVFYGTSITQGGCASRPGMCHTNIIGRKLGCETVNLGFSGNARMDKSMAEIVARAEASTYVIDCLPNCTAQIVRDSAYYFLSYIAKAHPKTPIYMVEYFVYPQEVVDSKLAKDLAEINKEWDALYKRLRKEGHKNLNYIPRKGLTGEDGEQTVDAAHLTDLGFLRYAESLLKWLK